MAAGKEYYKTLLRLAFPIAMQNLIAFAVNFADNIMVGRLGDVSISGVYMGNNVQTILQLIVNGISAALIILAAQYWGRRDMGSIRILAATCFRIAAGVGILFSVISIAFPRQIIGLMTNDLIVIEVASGYLQIVGVSFVFFSVSQLLIAALRGIENVRFGMYISLLALVVNIVLNYILIFGKLGFPALGVAGAAIATLCARVVECIVTVIYVFAKEDRLRLRFAKIFAADKVLLGLLFRYGAPVVLGEIVWAANTFAYNAIIGRFPVNTIAAFSIIGVMNTLVYVWIAGLAAAVGIMTGKMIGAGETDGIKSYTKRVQVMFLMVGIVTGLFVFFTKGILVSFYNVSSETVDIVRQLLTVLSITIVGTCYQMTCLAGLVKAGGNTSFVVKNDTIFVFLIMIPTAVIAMYLRAPAWVVFSCLKCDQVLKCFVAAVVVNRYKWMHNLTRLSE